MRMDFSCARSLFHPRVGRQKSCCVGSLADLPIGVFREAVAYSGSCPRAKYGGVGKENRASWSPSSSPCANPSTARMLQKPALQLVVRRPPGGCRLARKTNSTLVGGNPPPRLGA